MFHKQKENIHRKYIFSRTSTYGRMVAVDSGALLIIGSFKKRVPDPDFKVSPQNKKKWKK